MFKQLSIDIVTFLTSLAEFNAVMVRDGKTFLFPMVAYEDNALPLTTYSLGEKIAGSKDENSIDFTLNFWFSVEQYDQCCEFTDTIEEKLETVGFNATSSKIDFHEDAKTYYGQINVNALGYDISGI